MTRKDKETVFFIVTYCVSGGHTFLRKAEGESVEDVDHRVYEHLRTGDTWITFFDDLTVDTEPGKSRIRKADIVGIKIEPERKGYSGSGDDD